MTGPANSLSGSALMLSLRTAKLRRNALWLSVFPSVFPCFSIANCSIIPFRVKEENKNMRLSQWKQIIWKVRMNWDASIMGYSCVLWCKKYFDQIGIIRKYIDVDSKVPFLFSSNFIHFPFFFLNRSYHSVTCGWAGAVFEITRAFG